METIDFLDLTYPQPITIADRTYKNAYIACLACLSPKESRDLYTKLDTEQAEQMATQLELNKDTEEQDNIVRIILARKFQDPTLNAKLKALDEEVLAEIQGIQHPYLSQYVFRDSIVEALQSIWNNENLDNDTPEEVEIKRTGIYPSIPKVHFGFIKPIPHDPDKVLVKVPWPDLQGTVSVIIPLNDIYATEQTYKTKSGKIQNWMTIILKKTQYTLLYHDPNGNVDMNTIQPTISATDLVEKYERNLKKEIAKRKQQKKQQKQAHTEKPKKQSPNVLNGSNIWANDHSIYATAQAYPGIDQSTRLTIHNKITGDSYVISYPPITDTVIAPSMPFLVAIDATIFQPEIEALLAEHIIRTNLDKETNAPTMITSIGGKYAFHLFMLNIDALDDSCLTFVNNALEAYEKRGMPLWTPQLNKDNNQRLIRRKRTNMSLKEINRRIMRIENEPNEKIRHQMIIR